MYRAIIEVGGYKVGEIVPTEKAEHWLKVFKFPHVEEVTESTVTEEKSEEESEEESEKDSNKDSNKEGKSLGNILHDYLGRNQSVVKTNVLRDNLSKDQLQELLKLEELDKKRPLVINAIKQELDK